MSSTAWDTVCNSVGMELVSIPAGRFIMGGTGGKAAWREGEIPHPVTITRSFFIQSTPVTHRHWAVVMDLDPDGDDLDFPVTNVSWHRSREFIERLNGLDHALQYRLPSEAEWEYACRAGNDGVWCFGDDVARLGEYAWYMENAGETLHSVGLKRCNAWGLYDMHGNVPEWCEDVYQPYDPSPAVDPGGPVVRGRRRWAASKRIIRGGSFLTAAEYTRSASRNWSDPFSGRGHIGFRVAGDIRATDMD